MVIDLHFLHSPESICDLATPLSHLALAAIYDRAPRCLVFHSQLVHFLRDYGLLLRRYPAKKKTKLMNSQFLYSR